MRLLVVAQDFPPAVGGIQTYASELTRRLAVRAGETTIIAPVHPGAAESDATAGAPVARVPGSTDVFFASSLRRQMAAAADVAFFTSWPGALIPTLRDDARPRVISVHGREILLEPWRKLGPAQRAYDAGRRRVLTRAARLIPNSRFTAGLLEPFNIEADRVHVVSPGIDPSRFRDADGGALRQREGLGDRPVVLFVGRLVKRKGADQLLRAFAAVHGARPEALLALGGTGPEGDRLKQLATELGVSAHVRFLGRVPDHDLAPWYAAADVFAMPSTSTPPDVEGYGIVYLEANAAGTPVVGPNVGGPVDAILDGETGLTVDPEAPDAIAAALLRILGDDALRARMAARGRTWAEEHDWDRVADRIYGLLEAAVKTDR